MRRSFSSECAALGLDHLTKSSNAMLGAALTKALKEFGSRLRKKVNPPLPHHKVLEAVCNAAGFPSWDSFVSAARRLSGNSAIDDSSRSGFCDALPLLAPQQHSPRSTIAVHKFDDFAQRVHGHARVSLAFVNEALAEQWNESSRQAILDRAMEVGVFVLQVRADAVWPTVMGPLSELLADENHKSATLEAVVAAAQQGAKAHARALEDKLRLLGPDFPEQQRLFLHSKTLKELPWRRAPAHEADYDLCASFGYWTYCKEAVGKKGSRSWKQYRDRSWSAQGEPAYALETYPLLTSIACPSCKRQASVRVVALPGEEHPEGIWTLKCACGHLELRQTSPFDTQDSDLSGATDAPFVNCTCQGCANRRAASAKRLLPFSKGVKQRFSERLSSLVSLLEQGEKADSNVEARADGTVLVGGEFAFQYRERGIGGHFRRDGVIYQARAARGGRYLEPAPVTRFLQSEKGFFRKFSRSHRDCSPESVFAAELDLNPYEAVFATEDEKRLRKARAVDEVNRFFSEIPVEDANDFQQWLILSRQYACSEWLTVPVVAVSASSEEALNEWRQARKADAERSAPLDKVAGGA
jgi:hypothetical protein